MTLEHDVIKLRIFIGKLMSKKDLATEPDFIYTTERERESSHEQCGNRTTWLHIFKGSTFT